MRDLLNMLMGRKEPETIVIPLADFPKIFHYREEQIEKAFKDSVLEPVHAIRTAESQLRHIVNTIEGADQNPVLHPKLRNIAKNTLPQFVRSMKGVLAKELPDDPEEFYAATIEMVKGCLTSIKGPGRYLQIVFPDEMKTARNGIDVMGREMNKLTRSLATYRSAMSANADTRAAYENFIETRKNLAKVVERDHRIAGRIREIAGRLADIDRDLTLLSSDPQMSAAEAKKVSLYRLETQRDETARTYASLSMIASHVLRKAEKIAVRQKHPEEIAILHHAMDLLSDHELPNPADLEKALVDACPIVSRMIDAEEIPLKNKEERAIFSNTAQFRYNMQGTCTRLITEEGECRKASDELTLNPALTKQNSLQREKIQLTAMLERERTAQADLALFRERTQNQIPLLAEELRKKTEGIIGKNVQVQEEDSLSV